MIPQAQEGRPGGQRGRSAQLPSGIHPYAPHEEGTRSRAQALSPQRCGPTAQRHRGLVALMLLLRLSGAEVPGC